ncbi:MAG: hypothetical protein GY845_25790 [Planctomycetes bacterium]|nr:hypothetical protein [Planctomycetota bacterium]
MAKSEIEITISLTPDDWLSIIDIIENDKNFIAQEDFPYHKIMKVIEGALERKRKRKDR